MQQLHVCKSKDHDIASHICKDLFAKFVCFKNCPDCMVFDVKNDVFGISLDEDSDKVHVLHNL